MKTVISCFMSPKGKPKVGVQKNFLNKRTRETTCTPTLKIVAPPLRGRLMKAGYDEETMFSLDRPELLDELATVMLVEAETVQYPAEVGPELTELQVRLME